jgi:hypothetical protein
MSEGVSVIALESEDILEIMANALYVKPSSLIPLLKSCMLIYCLSIIFILGKGRAHIQVSKFSF